jgi:DNA-binding FadR family transcriptional regulator
MTDTTTTEAAATDKPQTPAEGIAAFREGIHQAFLAGHAADASEAMRTLLAVASELAVRQGMRRRDFKVLADTVFLGVKGVLEPGKEPKE